MWYVVVVKLKREREGAKGERRKERRGERVARENKSIQPFREESSGITPGENFQICGRKGGEALVPRHCQLLGYSND